MLVTGSDLAQARSRTRSSRPHSLLASSVPFSRCTIGGGTRFRRNGGAVSAIRRGFNCTPRPWRRLAWCLPTGPEVRKALSGRLLKIHTPAEKVKRLSLGRQVTVWAIVPLRQSPGAIVPDRPSGQLRRDTCRSPATHHRSGRSAAAVIPILGPTAGAGGGGVPS